MDLSPSPGQGLSGPRHHAFPHHSGVGASRELWRLRNLEKGVRPCPEEIWGCNKDAAGHVIRTGDKKKKKRNRKRGQEVKSKWSQRRTQGFSSELPSSPGKKRKRQFTQILTPRVEFEGIRFLCQSFPPGEGDMGTGALSPESSA